MSIEYLVGTRSNGRHREYSHQARCSSYTHRFPITRNHDTVDWDCNRNTRPRQSIGKVWMVSGKVWLPGRSFTSQAVFHYHHNTTESGLIISHIWRETGNPRESKPFGLASSEGLSLCDIMMRACVRRDPIETGSQRKKRGRGCPLMRTSSRRPAFTPLVR